MQGMTRRFLELIASGQREAARNLLLPQLPSMVKWGMRRRILANLTLDEHTVRSCAQEAIDDVVQKGESFDPNRGQSLSRWIFGFLFNKLRNAAKKEIRKRKIQDCHRSLDLTSFPDKNTLQQYELRVDMINAIAEIKDAKQRRILEEDLMCGGTAPTDQLCEVFKCTPQQVYDLRTRAHRSLAQRMIRGGYNEQ